MSKTAYRCPACQAGIVVNGEPPTRMVACPRCKRESALVSLQEIIPRKVICPSCRVILSVDPQLKGLIACPQCHTRHDVSLFVTYLAPTQPQDDTNKTVLPSSLLKTSKLGTLNLIEGHCSPSKIILRPGTNTIGRKSSTSSCSVPLDTADTYISRNHFSVEVRQRPDGNCEHCLSDAGSSNGTYHNGDKIENGDIIVLCSGDKIRAGATTFLFTSN